MPNFSRRDWLKLSVLSGLAAFAAACRWTLISLDEGTPQPTSQPTAADPTEVVDEPEDTEEPEEPEETEEPMETNTPAGPHEADVIVIGAGMAGLAAATQLIKDGNSVILLEGRERIGGRTWTDHTLGVPVDMGASWIHGVKDNPLTELANRFNATRISTNYDDMALYDADGRELSDAESDKIDRDFENMMENVYELQEELEGDISLQAAINRSAKSTRNLTYSINTTIEHEYGADVSDLSLFEWDQDGEQSGGDVIFPKGYEQLVNGLAKGLDIRTKTRVESIDYNDKTVRIGTGQGEFRCQRVVVTLPLGVLKKGSVRFSPELPSQKQKSISRLNMGVLNKVYLKFPKVFWDKETMIGYVASEKGRWCEWLNVHKFTGQPVLLGFNAGAYGVEIESENDDDIVDGAMTVLRRIYGDDIPDPEGWAITRWMSDPFAYGSYSHIPPGASGADYDQLSRPVSGRLFFAGEATHRVYPGTVHGAYLSGMRAAKEIKSL